MGQNRLYKKMGRNARITGVSSPIPRAMLLSVAGLSRTRGAPSDFAMPYPCCAFAFLWNLLERRWGRMGALCATAVLFGLSHFNKGAAFNWKYVLLATIAGIFYGRAWRASGGFLRRR